MQSYSSFLSSEITLYNNIIATGSFKNVFGLFLSAWMYRRVIYDSFQYNSIYRTSLLLDHLFRFIPIHGTYMFINYLFSPFLVKQFFPLCLGWRILFIFLFNITFCKMLIVAPLCIIRFMGHIRYLFIQSRYAVVWNARFHHQDHLDFVKHLINVYLLKKVYINS